MTEEDIIEMKKAKSILCNYCDYDGCEWCQVDKLIYAAIMKYKESQGECDEL